MEYLINQCLLYGFKIKELDGNRFSKTGFKVYDIETGFTVAIIKDIQKAYWLQRNENFISSLKKSEELRVIK